MGQIKFGSMTQQVSIISVVVVGVGTAHFTDDKEVLAVSVGDGVEGTKPIDCEGDDASTDATGLRVAVGSVCCVELVAAANVFKPNVTDLIVS